LDVGKILEPYWLLDEEINNHNSHRAGLSSEWMLGKYCILEPCWLVEKTNNLAILILNGVAALFEQVASMIGS
jgi:hypothetical protein